MKLEKGNEFFSVPFSEIGQAEPPREGQQEGCRLGGSDLEAKIFLELSADLPTGLVFCQWFPRANILNTDVALSFQMSFSKAGPEESEPRGGFEKP